MVGVLTGTRPLLSDPKAQQPVSGTDPRKRFRVEVDCAACEFGVGGCGFGLDFALSRNARFAILVSSHSMKFSTLNLPSATLANLATLGYAEMTDIQAGALPVVLQGGDVIGRARTGSGKTAVFGLGLLQRLQPEQFEVQALVLCPTRELAEQVAQEIRRLAQAIPNVKLITLCGGRPIGPQKGSLSHGAHIVVGTPGRVLDHLERGTLRLAALRTLVLDEADRMLDMGFAEDVASIANRAPDQRQTLLFSATYPDEIARMSGQIQQRPETITASADHAPETIEQLFFEVAKGQRDDALLHLLAHYQPASAVVFCTRRQQCAEVAEYLNGHGVEAVALHGDLDQRQRDLMLALFANGSTAVLVATDVAARGLDIKSLAMVINYELPHDPEVYVHRIGRTGRAGERGHAMSLFAERELKRLRLIESYRDEPCLIDTPASLDPVPLDFSLRGSKATLQLEGGRKAKMRKGDLLGALTGDAGLEGSQIGRIDLFDHHALVAIDRKVVKDALNYFSRNGKVKGRAVRARRVS